jgi:hypothetical protein
MVSGGTVEKRGRPELPGVKARADLTCAGQTGQRVKAILKQTKDQAEGKQRRVCGVGRRVSSNLWTSGLSK